MTTRKPLSHQHYRTIDRDYAKSAASARLTYISGNKDGIQRVKKGKNYIYTLKGKMIKSEKELQRIKKLAIPPSWTDVWICPSANGHLQATGLDMNKRKQYRYHADWSVLRNETKFHRLMEFGKALPRLRRRVNSDLGIKSLSAEKVIASAIRLMEQTSMRIGNEGYEKIYGSYGLTTLKDKHVNIMNGSAQFAFSGKKGVAQKITLKNRKLVNIIRQCRDIPGKDLFQYFQEDGTTSKIDSTMVNEYIKKNTQGDFSAKDLRTWAGSVEALNSLKTIGPYENEKDAKSKIVTVIDEVSTKLGNTRAICKKYYIHPYLLRLYEENKLLPLIAQAETSVKTNSSKLSKSENILLQLLKSYR